MKLLRYCIREASNYGILVENKIVSLPDLAGKQKAQIPDELSDLIAVGLPEAMKQVQHLIRDSSKKDTEACSTPVTNADIGAPILFPPKIICLGLNYRDHIEETGQRMPDEPVIFLKPHTAIIGPNDCIAKPEFVKELDYEAELAIVIGKRVKNVSRERAKDCVFGYTILNDVSARDIQFKDKQWTRGKSFDTFAPTGPCITTADELKDTSNLAVRTWVNDELRQNSSTAKMVFNIEETICHLSRVMTLEPCDIIATGTPSGVAFKMKPEPRFLQAGDTIRIEVEGIGILQNQVINAQEAGVSA